MNCDVGLPPRVDLKKELKNGEIVKELICKSLIDTVHDISDGGLLVAISEMSMKYDYGFDINLKKRNLNSYLFGEDQARYVISVEEKNLKKVRYILEEKDIYFEEIGKTVKDFIILNNEQIAVKELRNIYENWFNNYLSEAS